MTHRLQFAALVAALASAGFYATVLVGLVQRHAFGGDQVQYMAATGQELHGKWLAVYSLHGIGHLQDLPLVPLLFAPLVGLNLVQATLIWAVVTVAATIAAWFLGAPGKKVERALWLAGLLGSFPLAFTVGQGQLTGLVLLALAGCLRLLRQARPGWAGLCLAMALQLKPSVAYLAVPALLLVGQKRATLVAVLVSVGFLAAYVLIAGPGFPATYARALASSGLLQGQFGVGLPLYGGRLVGYLLYASFAAGALVLAWSSHSPTKALAIGVAGSLLASPYVGGYDLLVLFVAGWELEGRAKAIFALGPAIWALAPFTILTPLFEAVLAGALAGRRLLAVPQGADWMRLRSDVL
jgi:hypothetical protein